MVKGSYQTQIQTTDAKYTMPQIYQPENFKGFGTMKDTRLLTARAPDLIKELQGTTKIYGFENLR